MDILHEKVNMLIPSNTYFITYDDQLHINYYIRAVNYITNIDNNPTFYIISDNKKIHTIIDIKSNFKYINIDDSDLLIFALLNCKLGGICNKRYADIIINYGLIDKNKIIIYPYEYNIPYLISCNTNFSIYYLLTINVNQYILRNTCDLCTNLYMLL